jgi:hypothetical protein
MSVLKIFTPIQMKKSNVGKIIKSTKKKFSWEFLIEQEKHQIDLFVSRLSKKRSVYLNGYIVSKHMKDSQYFGNYPVKIGKYTIVVYETDENEFDLRIGELYFSQVLGNPKHGLKGSRSAKSVVRKEEKKGGKRRKTQKEFGFKDHLKEDGHLIDLDCIVDSGIKSKVEIKGLNDPFTPPPRYNPFDDLVEIETKSGFNQYAANQVKKLENRQDFSPVYISNSRDTSPNPFETLTPSSSTKSPDYVRQYYSPI